jgi:peptidoglycan/LPS O-acetylase OafA/YrhL
MSDGSRLIRVDGPSLGYIPAFDGFRGVFVLQVVLYHALVTDFLRGSPIIIDWFFVASGFLITSLLLDERSRSGANDLRRFYQRRALRLFPAMYLMIAVATVMLVVAVNFVPAAQEQLGNWWIEPLAAATYSYYVVAAFLPGELDGVLGHTWSLTVEEQFYFIWPLVLLVVLKARRRRSDVRLIVGSVLFVAVLMAIRVGFQSDIVQFGPDGATFTDEGDPTVQGVLYRLASARPDMIVYGCLFALVNRAIPRPLTERWRRGIAVGGAAGWVGFVGFILLGNRVPGFELFGGPAYQVCLLLLGPMILDLYLRQDSRAARWLAHPALRWLGVRSYGIYLWHIPVLFLFLAAGDGMTRAQRIPIGLVGAAAGVAAGVASFRFIELPFLRLKDRRFSEVPVTTSGAGTEQSTSDRPGTA